jgi:hypothetical protein
MANLPDTTSVSRFHNLPDSLLADAIGDLDCRSKAIEAELTAAATVIKAALAIAA